jgi:hypothetical protein
MLFLVGRDIVEPTVAETPAAHDRAEAVEISVLFVHASTQVSGIGPALLRGVFAIARAQEFGEFKSGPEPTTRRLSGSPSARNDPGRPTRPGSLLSPNPPMSDEFTRSGRSRPA